MDENYIRSFIFGAEDSLVSTVGVLFGLASSGIYQSRQLILAGLILITVEALSMGAGSYLSEKGIHEMETGNEHTDSPLLGGIIMYFSYFFAGFVALIPYAFLAQSSAKFYSIIFAVVVLYFLGYLPTKNIKSGIRMVVIAGLAVMLGFGVAVIFDRFPIL